MLSLSLFSLTTQDWQYKNYNKLTNRIKVIVEEISWEKIVLEDCYITAEKTENSEKKGCTQGTAPKRATCYSYKLPVYKFSAEDEKYLMFTP